MMYPGIPERTALNWQHRANGADYAAELAQVRAAKPDAPKPPGADHVAKVKKAADTWNEMAKAVRALYDNAMNWIAAGEEIDRQLEQMAKFTADSNTAMAVYVGRQFDAIRAYEEETAAIGMTRGELVALEVQRQAEIRDLRLSLEISVIHTAADRLASGLHADEGGIPEHAGEVALA